MADEMLKPSEVARMFGVDPKTVARWAKAGRVGSIRTPGGHRRFRRSEIVAFLDPPPDERRVPDQVDGVDEPSGA